ncbi:hypothetical protein BDY17DRAFT_271301 [Neohortaea acidophila]|uniref:Ribosomal protein S15 n=1 Tax=Neohortaea acidophila TaxID=245834 RepID=A0A6A6PJJ4_9PEZI|nr:uncharacterized protein BDY17DRAFT_271301 [Neohortaea acidophila]KAF2480238.1 hypothetical protein BDY17DRAFT_271301 [Neohortaea acidophila]
MPPRIPICQCLKASSNVTQHATAAFRPFTTSTSIQASKTTQRKGFRDPYATAQAKARKSANISRQEVLRIERAEALGDPVRGTETPYLRSLDEPPAPTSSAPSEPTSTAWKKDAGATATSSAETSGPLNYFLNKSELDKGLEYSKWLSKPSMEPQEYGSNSKFTDEKTPEERAADVEKVQANAEEALRRIADLSLGSSKDRMRVNVQRIIQDFGRHTTDSTLPPRLPSSVPQSDEQLPATPRVGPDTGSSEVQVAILTAKIRTLVQFLETRGTMDKANKRNLRLLVHRRAKLLKYLRRKERGGPRFQNVVKTLGLTEGTWKGEINIVGPLGGHSPIRLAKLQARGWGVP